MAITRRGLLAGGAAGGGLVVAWWLMPRSYRSPLVPARAEHVFGAYLKIAADGVVSVAVPQLEMGQGITTLLPQIVAHELGADWRQIAVEPAPLSGAYANIPLAEAWMGIWDASFAGISRSSDDLLALRFAQRRRFFQLRNQRRPAVDDRLRHRDVGYRLHERQRHKVHADFERELKVCLVLVRQRFHRERLAHEDR